MSKSFLVIMKTAFLKLRESSGLSTSEAAEKCGISVRTMYRWEKGECKPKSLAIEKLTDITKRANNVKSIRDKGFRYIDLFAGIGGFRRAFDAIGGECVFTSEWDKACRTTYQANYTSNHSVEGDIRDFTKDEESLERIPKHDLLVAGFPCQPFSLAGVSKKNALGRAHGFLCQTQGTLFFDLARIIQYHQPKVFLLENVKNLVSHDGGNTFKVIKNTLEKELEYKISFRIIDGRSWVPQHRERIFIVGFKKEVGFNLGDIVLPDNKPTLESILHNKNEEDEFPYFLDGKVAPKYTLTPRLWEFLKSYKEKHQAAGNGFGFSLVGPHDVSRTLSARYYKDGSEILIKQDNGIPRRLTPRECARLMGFDQPNESNFQIPVSDTQAYRQFGNSVIVPVAHAVASLMKPFIQKAIDIDSSQLRLPYSEMSINTKYA